jgi:transcriptional regulator with XRE-family HTH domain
MVVTLKATALRQALVERNLTQRHFARIAGLSAVHLSQLLAGRRCPGPGTRGRLLGALPGVDFHNIFTVNGGPRPRRGRRAGRAA